MLEAGVYEEISEFYEWLDKENALLSEDRLAAYYGAFRDRFGPDRLERIEGQELLETIHDNSDQNSLLYWLEFKNDEEFQTSKLGSIRGGSALKFGVFRSAKTGSWMGKGAGGKPVEISSEQAIGLATRYRDQLVRGAKLLDELPEGANAADYESLQKRMDELAPGVSRLSWGHKYFSLLYPDKLDDYHNPDYQRFHLIKMLQMPPEGDGRYIAAAQYVAVARELEIPMARLTRTLNERHGVPYRYWRIGTSNGEQPRNRWKIMRDGGCVAIGWRELGDLAPLLSGEGAREGIKRLVGEKYPDIPQQVGRESRQVFRFVKELSDGDLVLAADGGMVLGVGKIVGGYGFDPTSDFPHRRPVEWLSLEEWPPPHSQEGQQTAVHEIRSHENMLEAEKHIFEPDEPPKNGEDGIERSTHIVSLNTILFGPPGTGKTYTVQRRAVEITEPSAANLPDGEIGEKFREYRDEGRIEFVTFHPSFSYEEFVEGFRYDPEKKVPTLHDGVFKEICHAADGTEVVGVEGEGRVWKVSLGGRGEHRVFERCMENGEVAVGWLHGIDLTGADARRIAELFREHHPGSNFRSTNRLVNEMHEGDYVAVYDSPTAIRAIGVVTGGYEFKDEYEDGYHHVRPVRWLDREARDIHALNGNTRLTMETVYNLWRIPPSKLAALLPDTPEPETEKPYVLIIDEINRGNISRIFGELITLLEPDKRRGAENELSVKLPYSQKDFAVPANLHVIGTMNTADRSIALLDVALRRRFEFEEMMPRVDVVKKVLSGDAETVTDVKLICDIFEILNARITALLDRDHAIGHSYFLSATSPEGLCHALYRRVFPLLQEYFYNDVERLARLLGEYRADEKTGFIERPDLNFGKDFSHDTGVDDVLWKFHEYTADEIEGVLRRTFVGG